MRNNLIEYLEKCFSVISIVMFCIMLVVVLFDMSMGSNTYTTDTKATVTKTTMPNNTITTTSKCIKTEHKSTIKQTVRFTKQKKVTKELEVPNISDFKSWTKYTSISRKSKQWHIVTQNGSYTDDNGFRRINDDYMVAMGSYYVNNLGERFKITTSTGSIFTVTICDMKSDNDTDSKHQYTLFNNCIVEFYVSDNICNSVQISGTASSISSLSGKITKIEKIN